MSSSAAISTGKPSKTLSPTSLMNHLGDTSKTSFSGALGLAKQFGTES